MKEITKRVRLNAKYNQRDDNRMFSRLKKANRNNKILLEHQIYPIWYFIEVCNLREVHQRDRNLLIKSKAHFKSRVCIFEYTK